MSNNLHQNRTLTPEAIRTMFLETNALLQGHFLLTSGKHSEQYVQCAQVMQFPEKARLLAQQLAAAYADSAVSVVVGPAMGGIHLAHEVAHALGVRSLFTERVDGKMALRRNFAIAPGERILVVEDVITTGGSVREVIRLLQELGGHVIGIGCLVDRTPADSPFQSADSTERSLPLAALLRLDIQAYEPESCPLCARGLPWEKPGSRKAL